MTRIAVIGAGPAGLTAAITAATRGLAVTLLERKRVGENIACAEGYYDLLKLTTPPRRGIRLQIETIRFAFAGRNHDLPAAHLGITMINRQLWQQELAGEALRLGVRIMENCPVLPAHIPALQKEYDYLVDAGGVSSPTVRFFGLRNDPARRPFRAIQYTLEGDFSSLGATLLIRPTRGFFGYRWVFPLGPPGKWHRANAGVGFMPEAGRSGPRLLSEMEKTLYAENLAGCRIIRRCRGLIPAAAIEPPLVGNILLAGDAAGLASPLHGGGINAAVYSGQAAAESIAGGNPQSYRDLLAGTLKRKLEAELAISILWQRLGSRGLEALIKVLCGKHDRSTLVTFFGFRQELIHCRREVLYYAEKMLPGKPGLGLIREILGR